MWVYWNISIYSHLYSHAKEGYRAPMATYKKCLALDHLSTSCQKFMVVCICKPRNDNYSNRKNFRQINLTSFPLKYLVGPMSLFLFGFKDEDATLKGE